MSLPSFEFNDGAHDVQTVDAGTVYKGLVEHALRSRWNRPENIEDEKFVAEVELTVDEKGSVTGFAGSRARATRLGQFREGRRRRDEGSQPAAAQGFSTVFRRAL